MSTEEDVIDKQGIDQHTHHHAEAEAAGAVRGLARSLGRWSGVVGRSAAKSAETISESVGSSAGRSVGKQVGKSVGKEVGMSVGQEVAKAIEKDIGEFVGKEVGKKAGQEVVKAVGKDIGESLGEEVGKSVGKSVGQEVVKTIGKDLGISVGKDIGESVGKEMGKSVGQEVARAVGKDFGESFGKEVSKAMGKDFGESFGNEVKSVGREVAKAVGEDLGESVGQEVGKSFGKEITRAVGEDLGETVGNEVGKSVGKEVVEKAVGKDLGKPAAGSVAERSVSLPPVQLSRQGAVNLGLGQRIGTREVAKVSDSLSTGYDWWSWAVESSDDSASSKDKPALWRRARTLCMPLVKNTLLGMAVYESYEYTVGLMAPPPPPLLVPNEFSDNAQGDLNVAPEDECSNTATECKDDAMLPKKHQGFSLGDGEFFQLHEMNDDYARASLPAHFLAGGVGGSVQGIAEALMERSVRRLPGFSHAILFGSYESLKRVLLPQRGMFTVGESQQLGFLASFTLAGGLAGQLQHVVSHYTEQLISETNQTHSKSLAVRTRCSGAFFRRKITHPAMRSTLIAFLPGAIGFVAFEYGKQIATEWAI